MDKTSILFSISLTEQFEKLWGQFGAKTKKSPSQISERAIKVIRLGFEPKTHSLEGCCSIQLSYRTDPYFLISDPQLRRLLPCVGCWFSVRGCKGNAFF